MEKKTIIILVTIMLVLATILASKIFISKDIISDNNEINIANVAYNIQMGAMEAIGEASKELSEMAIQQFNSVFEIYKGERSGANVRALIQTTMTHNMTYIDEKDKLVTIEYCGVDYLENLSELKKLIDVSKQYVVDFKYNSSTELIEKVFIK